MAHLLGQHEMIVRPEKAHRLGHAEACPLAEGSKRLVDWLVGGGKGVFVLCCALVDCMQPVDEGSQQVDTGVSSTVNWQAFSLSGCVMGRGTALAL